MERVYDAGGTSRSTKPSRAPSTKAARHQRRHPAGVKRSHYRTQFTGENEWYTPAEYVEAARTCLGSIDLDPATAPLAQKTVRDARFFTRADDGLRHEWRGRVWLNPPYAQPDISRFVDKLLARSGRRATQAILLTHNYTDTGWFHAAAGKSAAICFTRGRIKFVSPDRPIAAPTQGQPSSTSARASTGSGNFGSFGFIRSFRRTDITRFAGTA